MDKHIISKRVLDQLTRRKRVQELRQEGLTEVEIAAQLGIAQSTVSKDLAVIAKHLQAAIVESGLLAEEVERYRWVERQARAGWTRSQRDKQTRFVKKKTDENGAESTETNVREEGQAGDPSFLAQAREAVTARLRALGLFNEKREHTVSEVKPIQIIEIVKVQREPQRDTTLPPPVLPAPGRSLMIPLPPIRSENDAPSASVQARSPVDQ